MFQRIQELEAAGVHRNRTLYLNLEDDRLHPWSSGDPASAEESFYRQFPEARESTAYFFLDEIQAVPGWERSPEGSSMAAKSHFS